MLRFPDHSQFHYSTFSGTATDWLRLAGRFGPPWHFLISKFTEWFMYIYNAGVGVSPCPTCLYGLHLVLICSMAWSIPLPVPLLDTYIFFRAFIFRHPHHLYKIISRVYMHISPQLLNNWWVRDSHGVLTNCPADIIFKEMGWLCGYPWPGFMFKDEHHRRSISSILWIP